MNSTAESMFQILTNLLARVMIMIRSMTMATRPVTKYSITIAMYLTLFFLYRGGVSSTGITCLPAGLCRRESRSALTGVARTSSTPSRHPP